MDYLAAIHSRIHLLTIGFLYQMVFYHLRNTPHFISSSHNSFHCNNIFNNTHLDMSIFFDDHLTQPTKHKHYFHKSSTYRINSSTCTSLLVNQFIKTTNQQNIKIIKHHLHHAASIYHLNSSTYHHPSRLIWIAFLFS